MTVKLHLKVGCFFLILSLLFIVFMVPTISEDWREASFTDAELFAVGPRFFPYLAASIIALLSVVLIIGSSKEKTPVNSDIQGFITKEQLKHVSFFIIIGVVYISILNLLGVLIATPLILLCYFLYFEIKNWFLITALSIGTTIIIYFCFAKLMMVPLPMGLLG